VSADGKFDRSVIRSIIEMRACLGPDVARLAAQRARRENVAAIEAGAALVDDVDATLVQRSHHSLDLWDAIVDASDNVAYRLAYNSLRACYEPIAGFLAETIAGELNDRAGRARLIVAIRDGKPDAAERAAARLLATSTVALTELVSRLPEEVAR
jgi:DNA-binding FadR family transcriptional regulator